MFNFLSGLTGVFGVLAIAVGALAAHSGLSEREAMWVTTGVRYHLPHLAVLFAALLTVKCLPEKFEVTKTWLLRACVLWGLGILGFCCGLYAQAFFGVKLGMIVPLGAMLMMLGWLVSVFAFVKGDKHV